MTLWEGRPRRDKAGTACPKKTQSITPGPGLSHKAKEQHDSGDDKAGAGDQGVYGLFSA